MKVKCHFTACLSPCDPCHLPFHKEAERGSQGGAQGTTCLCTGSEKAPRDLAGTRKTPCGHPQNTLLAYAKSFKRPPKNSRHFFYTFPKYTYLMPSSCAIRLASFNV